MAISFLIYTEENSRLKEEKIISAISNMSNIHNSYGSENDVPDLELEFDFSYSEYRSRIKFGVNLDAIFLEGNIEAILMFAFQFQKSISQDLQFTNFDTTFNLVLNSYKSYENLYQAYLIATENQ